MQAFGRTPLTAISPKKTWEGVAAGLGGCIATSVLLSRILSWPPSFLRYLVLEDSYRYSVIHLDWSARKVSVVPVRQWMNCSDVVLNINMYPFYGTT